MHGELNINKFRDTINLLYEVCDECIFNISKNGLDVKLVDRSNVCMVWLTIPNTSFEKYTCKSDIVIGADLSKIKKALTKAHRFGTKLVIDIDDDITMSCGSYSFGVHHLDVGTIRKQPRIPNLDDKHLSNEFIISSNNLKNAFEIVDSDYVFIKSDNGVISVYRDFADVADFVEISFTDEITINRCKDAISLMSLDYLNDILPKIKHVCKNVLVEFGKDFPFKISCYESDVKFSYLQAHRIESD